MTTHTAAAATGLPGERPFSPRSARTPATNTETMRANAFAAMEADIAEVYGAVAVLDIVSRSTLNRLSAEQAAMFHIPAGVLQDYRMYALTEEQDEALSHARMHLENLIRQLERNYRFADVGTSS